MIRKLAFTAALMGAVLAGAAPTASAGPDEYLGEIITVGFNFCPRGTLDADGRLLSINENTALFSLYGTQYGGDGRTTFALPDLQGRTIVSAGKGPGAADFPIGQKGPLGAGSGPLHEQGNQGNAPAYLVLRQCVVTQGIYPSRD
tara:strand:- start:208 stop:642 length:435 start_codon:yes stop_codon:yes gene_type:complete